MFKMFKMFNMFQMFNPLVPVRSIWAFCGKQSQMELSAKKREFDSGIQSLKCLKCKMFKMFKMFNPLVLVRSI